MNGRSQSGQALVLMVGAMAAIVTGALLLGALGRAYGAKSHAQRAADLAAISAARAMREAYPRLFEPAVLSGGVPNPRHLSPAAYMALARAAAVQGASSNGAQIGAGDVSFPDAASFAPVRVAVAVRGRATLRLSAARWAELPVAARATAALVPGAGGVDPGTGGGYAGPLAYRQGKPMRPDVAQAFDRMAAAAARDGVRRLLITSAFRTDAEQAILWWRNTPDPKWVARPGTSLHRNGTELDLGPASAYAWLHANAGRFHFSQR